MKFNLNPLSYF